MARTDSLGLFWQDKEPKKGDPIRDMPKIKSKWRALSPDRWPNLQNEKIIGLDVETYDPNLTTHGPGWARHDGHLVGISVATSRNNSWYFPMRHTIKPKQNLNPDKVLEWAADNLSGLSTKVGANIGYDVGWLREEGVYVGGKFIDIQHNEKLIDENKFNYSLEALAQQYLGVGKESHKLYKWLARFYGGKIDGKQRANIYRAPPSLVGPYAEGDAWEPLKIWKKQQVTIKIEGLERVLDIEQRLIPMLIDMRFRGVRVNLDYAEQMRERLIKMEAKIQYQLDKIAGKHVRFNAPASIVGGFENLGIPYEFTEEGNPSFAKAFLKSCPHEIAKLILKIREVNKLRSTFIEGALLEKHVNGRVYCQFNQFGAKQTGRFSSSNPNLQQVPSRTELGREIRRCFIPDFGFSDWYRKDYSQIEYRHLAHHAVGKGSNNIRKMYRKNPKTDYHKAATKLIYIITRILLERKPTKTINFGIVYGMGKPKLCASLGLSKDAGDQLFEAYHEGMPFAATTFDYFMNMAAQQGYVTTALGRRGRFPMWEEAHARDGDLYRSRRQAITATGSTNVQRAMTHKALNKVLQGGAADHMKKAMVETYEAGVYDAIGGVPSLTVHDELDGSTNYDDCEEAHLEMKHIMETCLPLKVPVIVDTEIGSNWADTHEVFYAN